MTDGDCRQPDPERVDRQRIYARLREQSGIERMRQIARESRRERERIEALKRGSSHAETAIWFIVGVGFALFVLPRILVGCLP